MLSTWFTLNLNCPCISAWLVYQYVLVCWTRIAYLNIARLEDNARHIAYITPRMCGRTLIRNHFLNMFPSLHVTSWKKEFHHLLTCYNAGTQVSASLLMLVVRYGSEGHGFNGCFTGRFWPCILTEAQATCRAELAKATAFCDSACLWRWTCWWSLAARFFFFFCMFW